MTAACPTRSALLASCTMLRLLLALTTLVAAAVFFAACGGGGDDNRDIVSSRAVPTATLPSPLPTPLLVGSEGFRGAAGRAGGQTYTVQSGDTYSAIAQRYDIIVANLLQANGLSADAILRVGQRLVIPAPETLGGGTLGANPSSTATRTATPTRTPAATATATRPAGSRTYTVKDGDIASAIADQFNVTVDALARANGMTVEQISRLRVGQELVIP